MTDKSSPPYTISLKLVGLSDIEKLEFQSILAVAENKLNIPWQTVTSIKANFYLLSHRLKPQMDKNDLLRSFHPTRCIFFDYKTENSEENALIFGKKCLPLRSLASFFNALSASFDIESQTLNSIKYKPSSSQLKLSIEKFISNTSQENIFLSKDEDMYFDPKQGFIGELLLNQSNVFRFEVSPSNNGTVLYINFESKVYFSKKKLDQLDSFFSDQVVSTQISDAILQQEIEINKLRPIPLKHLIWYAVFNQSQGRAKNSFQSSDIVYLHAWPDINIPGCRELIKLAAYMKSNASTLSIAQKKTGYSIQTIYNFYNACDAIGLIKHSQKTDIVEKNIDKKQQQLIFKINNRLRHVKS